MPLSSQKPSVATITRGQVYLMPDFQRITGLKAYAVRTMRRNGLVVSYIGNRVFVSGDAFHDYLEKNSGASGADRYMRRADRNSQSDATESAIAAAVPVSVDPASAAV